jgi:hypothetical protein
MKGAESGSLMSVGCGTKCTATRLSTRSLVESKFSSSSGFLRIAFACVCSAMLCSCVCCAFCSRVYITSLLRFNLL